MRIVCIGHTHSRLLSACVCDVAYRSVNPLVAIPDIVYPYRVRISRLPLNSRSLVSKRGKFIKNLTIQRRRVYTRGLALADMRRARGRTWRLVSKDLAIRTMRGDGGRAHG